MPDRPDTLSRSKALKRLRPDVPVDTTASKAIETFQHETLRPILKLLNPLILRLVASYVMKYNAAFPGFSRADKTAYVRGLLKDDGRLKRTLLGMAMGHFTEKEFDFYLAHTAEVRRRAVALLVQRVEDQVEALPVEESRRAD